MYNGLKKTASEVANIPTQLGDKQKNDKSTADGLLPWNGLLDTARANKDLTSTTEVQLEDGRDTPDLNNVEAKLSKYQHTGQFENNDRRPLHDLNNEQEKNRDIDFKKAMEAADTNFWDSYVGIARPSTVVASSLSTLDQQLFVTYLRPALERRGLTAKEKRLVATINSAKESVLAQNLSHEDALAGKIEKLEQLLQITPPTSPEYDRMKEELESAITLARQSATPAAQPHPVDPALAAPAAPQPAAQAPDPSPTPAVPPIAR